MKRKKRLKQIVSLLMIAAVLMTPASFTAFAADGEEMSVPVTAEETVTEGKILSFERDNPVYSLNAFKGSTFDELGLPKELRVVMEIEEEDKGNFVEAVPEPEEDGNYTYYSYGYVAPKADTVAEGELSLYTISYFDGTTGYRVYGVPWRWRKQLFCL